MNESLATCLEARAVYVEIISFVAQLDQTGRGRWSADGGSPSIAFDTHGLDAPSALLRTSVAVSTTRDLLRRSRIDDLGHALRDALRRDVDVACAMLEALSRASPPPNAGADPEAATATACALARMYIDVCAATQAPGPRTFALRCLGDALDGLLARGPAVPSQLLPALGGRAGIARFWAGLQGAGRALSPGLADAVVRLSGPLLALLCVSGPGADDAREDDGDMPPRWLGAWGAMMSDAGRDDRVRVLPFISFDQPACPIPRSSVPY